MFICSYHKFLESALRSAEFLRKNLGLKEIEVWEIEKDKNGNCFIVVQAIPTIGRRPKVKLIRKVN
jgi:hypothetical protein